MKFLFDLFPVILFFAAYQIFDIYVAAAVAILAAVIQIVWTLARKEKVKPIQWIGLGFLVVFGGATIILRDEFYIKVKWTLFYGLMASLILGAVALRKNPLKSVLGQELEIELPEEAWRKLAIAWGLFFLLLAVLNQYFANTVSLAAWVKIKVFGGMALAFIFILAQSFWMAKYLPDTEEQPKE
jgi:intracellular septation protein